MKQHLRAETKAPYLQTLLKLASWLAFPFFAARRFINPLVRGLLMGKFLGFSAGAIVGHVVAIGVAGVIVSATGPVIGTGIIVGWLAYNNS